MDDLPTLAALTERARALHQRIDAALEQCSESDAALQVLREELSRIKECLKALEELTRDA